MELWNDYEGKLLDGQFRLDRLIGPKGRSAFFTTTDKDGMSATVRVIESLNDEDEILARWNAVRAMDESTLVSILACNKTVLDGVHLVYAVLESTDAELSDLLKERALTPEETRQMAASVVTALEALHAKGLIHEHVDAESVLAKGEEVKLRGDCVREAPEGLEGETLKRRDAHDLAMLVGYALTQRRDLGQARLARPFDDFVRNGMSGTWGLKEMAGVVRPVAVSSSPIVSAPSAEVKSLQTKQNVPATNGIVPSNASGSMTGPKALPARPAASPMTRSGGTAAPSTSAQAVAASLATEAPVPMRRPTAEDRIVLEPEEGTKSRSLFWVALAVAAVLLVGLIWHFTHVSTSPEKASVAAAPVSTPAQTPMADVPAAPVKPSAATGKGRVAGAARGAAVAAGARPTGAAAGSQWRLVAYTFNREEQAQRKVEAIAQTHPALKPEVFTPSGRAPYLVALGGWMSVDEAAALKSKARSEGMPRDIYTQNYRGH